MKIKVDITDYFYSDKEIIEQYSKDSVYEGHPDFVYRAGDWETVQEVLQYCSENKLPVTFCGSQTSMTGASVADEGLALSMSLKNKILDIGVDKKTNEPYVITEPGVILADLKKAVKAEGFYYPPDPTSFNEVQVGSTIATNATGECSFKYGSSRKYVDSLEVICADGHIKTLARQKKVPLMIQKNRGGYCLDGEEIDEIIASEGTLALIKQLKLRLINHEEPNVFLLMIPFSSFEKCIQAASLLLKKEKQPVALELVGPGASDYFQKCSACPEELKKEKNFLYIKDEYHSEMDFRNSIDAWFNLLTQVYRQVNDPAPLERVFMARTDQQLKDIHECRHYIPLMVNEECFKFHADGGGKVGTDWWVPTRHMYDMMMNVYKKAKEINVPFLVFAHIGAGHPHWNFLAKNKEQWQIAKNFIKLQCKQAVHYGGGVAGEHGLGKIKKDLLEIQHQPPVIRKMLALKNKWDPNWIFGKGNIFSA